jgi:hypothetical protein
MSTKRKKIDKLCDYMRKLYSEYQMFNSFEPNADLKIKYKAKADLLQHLLSEARCIKQESK